MRLRSSLFLLAAAAAVPVLALALFALAHVIRNENQAIVDTAKVRNRATLEAIDAELRDSLSTLRALAASPTLDQGDWQGFDHEARTVLGTQPTWRNVVLEDSQGRQVTNARLPWGAKLPQAAVETRALQMAVGGQPAISDISFAAELDGEPGIKVRVPVVRDGQVRLVLSAMVDPAAFQRILERQQLPGDWVSGLSGTDGRLIARVPPVPAGRLASDEFRAQVARADEGWYRGPTLEGRDAYTAFSRSRLTGWAIGFAMPSQLIVGGGQRAAALLATGLLLSLAAAAALVAWLSRRIADPIALLAHGAAGLRTGHAPAMPTSAIDELQRLSRALAETAVAIRDRDDELVRRGEELEQQARALREVDAHKTRFLAQVSHELRTPLATLRNAMTVWQSSGDARRQAHARALMDRQLTLLTRMVDDLVDIGRVGRGELQLRTAPVALDGLVQDCVDGLVPLLQQKAQHLVVRHAPVPVIVHADADRLCQVLVNLLTNASRYTGRGGHIEVRVGEEDGQAVLEVADDGVGFTPSDGVRMFEMFVRVGQGDTAPGSLGIGLAITRTIVQLHGGRVEASSAGRGRGATFRVRLPLPPPDVAVAPKALPAPAPL